MKRLLITFIALLLTSTMMAGSLVKISYEGRAELERLFADSNLKIHYYTDSDVFATAEQLDASYVLLDDEAFDQNEVYTLVYCPKQEQAEYLSTKGITALLQTNNYLVVKGSAMPYKNDGAVAIFNKEARLPRLTRDFPVVTEVDARIREMMNQVNMDSIEYTVQYMQDYMNRFWNSNNAFDCSDWIAGRMEALGLEVEQQPFYANTWTGSGNAAPNVIGIQRGTLYPDTYVVCGSHFDSFSYAAIYGGGNCPGADDNATGVASVLESARIMTQYEFEYSIIYCAFGCEEMGLYGSEAYASRCQQQDMDIIGYFNNDMNGYLWGDQIHIHCIYPNTVAPIGDYYMNVGSVYFPEMPVEHKILDYGDSDHTSFNNHGYMGIYPFEDIDHDSPYIHSEDDLIGNSVNSFAMSQRYCQMNIGCLAEIANPMGETPPVQCNPVVEFQAYNPIVVKEQSHIYLEWLAPEPGSTGECVSYDIYRDNEKIASLPNDIDAPYFEYHDTITVGVTADYFVTAVYDDGCEAPSETQTVVGMPEAVSEAGLEKALVYPNPVDGLLTIKAHGLQQVAIFNGMGQKISTSPASEDVFLIDMDAYPRGFYIVQLITENGVVTKEIVVK
ncbi:MAG: M28 family peptidase [Bacteroidales bacterium]|nr:M28 family peptidase [Bacteroidales bacterium]